MRLFSLRHPALMFVCFLVLGLIVYGASLSNQFVLWDDNYLVYLNPAIRGITPWTLTQAFTTFDPELYIPFTIISYQIDYLLAGREAAMFHFTNLLLHTVNATFIFVFLKKILSQLWDDRSVYTLSVLGALIFLLHPLNTEVAVWASARKDVLSTFFYLAALLSYLSWREDGNKKLYTACIALFIAATLSKVMAVSFPIILLLLDWLLGRKWSKEMLIEKIPFFIISIAMGVVALVGKGNTTVESSIIDKMLMGAKSSLFYIQKFVWPDVFAIMYPYDDDILLSSPSFWVPLVLALILIGITVWSLRFGRTVLFSVFFFLITLSPTLVSFTRAGAAYIGFDRYAYLPSVGLILLVLLLIHSLKQYRQVGTWVMSTLLIVLGLLSYNQSLVWKDSPTLFAHALETGPTHAPAYNNLGLAYIAADKFDEASDLFHQALAYDPTYSHSLKNLADIAKKNGNKEKSKRLLQEVLEIEPEYTDAIFELGMIAHREGNIPVAISRFEEALSINPEYLAARNNLGAIALHAGDDKQAAEHFKTVMRQNPYYPDPYFNLGVIRRNSNNNVEAMYLFERHLDLKPDAIDTLQELIPLYFATKQFDEAIDRLEAALRRTPKERPLLELSLSTARSIMSIEPQHTKARDFLRWMIDMGLVEAR